MFDIRPARSLHRLLWIAFFIRLSASLLKSFGGLAMPHVWRQSDTLGVASRYWLRWTQEPFDLKSLLPAVLQSGDGNGIMPMEFPLLNLVFAPAFALGPYWGKVVATLGFTLLIYALVHSLYRSRFWLAPGFLLLPTLSYSADYIDKFMPDILANLLVTWGALRLLRHRTGSALIAITLGLLMKPTAVVALGLLFITSRFRKRWLPFCLRLIVPVVITGWYYTRGVEWIDSFRSGTPGMFAVNMRDPLHSLLEVWMTPDFLLHELQDRLFMAYGIVLFCVAAVWGRLRAKKKFLLWAGGILFLQFNTIAALDGSHLGQHDYYLIGLAPLAVTLFWAALRSAPKRLQQVIGVIVLLHALELSLQNLGPSRFTSFYRLHADCLSLKQGTPELPWNRGQPFRSPPSPYPTLGLCFGEREGSERAPFGFFRAEDPLPAPCRELRRQDSVRVATCTPD
jgi:uncharacterized membrane protein YuzA (DUF378 family)